jgi:hypothetical protein
VFQSPAQAALASAKLRTVAIRGICFLSKAHEARGAIWTDLVRTCDLADNTLLRYEEGVIEAEGDKGGIYLVLYSKSRGSSV